MTLFVAPKSSKAFIFTPLTKTKTSARLVLKNGLADILQITAFLLTLELEFCAILPESSFFGANGNS